MYLITAASGNLIFPAEDELRGVSGLFYRLGINTAMDGITLVSRLSWCLWPISSLIQSLLLGFTQGLPVLDSISSISYPYSL